VGYNKPDTLPDPVNGLPYLTFSLVAQNTGSDSFGPIFIKVYISDGMKLEHESSDEKNFKYEAYLPPDSLDPNTMPSNMPIANDLLVGPVPDVKPGKCPALIKVYYGKGEIAHAPIVFVVPEGTR
jgi:hypothetical protein